MPDSGNTVGSGAPPSGAFEASAFRRPWHRLVARVLASLNRPLLASAKCYFGGGTRIVMELDEFRESVDIDFLCSDRAGYRLLRNAVTERSLGEIFIGDYELIREVRRDMYGIRDGSTNARDLLDLAFMAARWPRQSWDPAMKAAESAYGDVVARELDVGLPRFADPSRRRRCVEALGIADTRTLARGLRILRTLL